MAVRGGQAIEAQEVAQTASVPAWVKHEIPEWIHPHVGKRGLPDPWPQRADLGAGELVGIDLWQANNFVVHRTETAEFLYRDYTPLKVDYRKGTFPVLEEIVARHTAGLTSDRDKAARLLTAAMPALLRHPALPPYKTLRVDRNFDEEQLVQSGEAWCSEQARVFVRLCQAAGNPARMVYLFYADNQNGHTIAEFYAQGRWCMADATYFCVFPAEDGRLMSAAEAHEKTGPAREQVRAAYAGSFAKILKMSDANMGGAAVRQEMVARQELVGTLGAFGLLNYPLPR